MEDKISQNKINVDSSFEFVPQNPFTIDGSTSQGNENISYPGFPVEEEKTGILKSALLEFKQESTNIHALHAAENKSYEENKPSTQARYLLPESYLDTKFSYKPTPDGWSPKEEIEKQTNINPAFIPRLLASKNPQDFQYRLNDAIQQQKEDIELANGSTFGKIIGGLVGLSPIGSIENFIPIAAVAAKAKVGSSFLNAMIKAFPGTLAASAVREGAQQMDKQDSSLGDFVKDTFVDAAFGTAFFGSLGAGKALLNVSEFNRLKDFSKKYLKGVGYEYIVNKEGALTGFKAVDTTGGSIGAAEVTKAQELADSAFYKGGLFKIPYVGTAALHLLSGNVPGFKYLFGSPLIQLKISKYKNANAFADAGFDHFITTEGEAKGGTRPESFESKVKRTRAELTDLKMQTEALYAERNGYAIKNRPAIGVQNSFYASKQKALETLAMDTQKTNFISKDDFMDEAQRVLYSGESHENSAVNKLAGIYRPIIDKTFKEYREAHGLPEDWLPPKTAVSYLMRVYDTGYLNTNEGQKSFISVVSNWLKESDAAIAEHLRPINEAKNAIEKRRLSDKLSNRMRSDQDLFIHIDDPNALSADEAKQINDILAPINSKKEALETLKKGNKKELKEKIREAENAIQEEELKLQDKLSSGEVRPNLYYKVPESQMYKLKDPINRLKFRDTYESDFHRNTAAQAYYDSIMNLKPEDIIADVFGKITGNTSENHLKRRTLPVPDEILYNNKFMTKDLYAKTANYVNYLSRRTHLKTSFQNVTVNGGFEELAEGLLGEYKSNRSLISNRIDKLKEEKQSAKRDKGIAAEEKAIRKETKDFQDIKKVMKTLYETRMMGVNKRSEFDNMARNTLMSITAAANLHNLGATQITDLGFVGYQHGIWPFVRDGVYPFLNWLATAGKGRDSEALRQATPHINLGLQDMLNHTADRNFNMDLQPYLNMGKIESGIQKFAHFSSLTDLTPYIDNGIQHTAGSVIQSNFMEYMEKAAKETLTNKESLYLRKYGLDPKKWADRMFKAYEESEGFKTAAGGYMSNFWKWQDMEASNEFSKAVFRGVQNTLVWKGMADSPFFADNMLGMFFHTFTGWGYAATNRYLIPSLQHPDGELLLKMIWMYGAGSLVSPTRRMARGESAYPEDMTWQQKAYEAFTDSGVFSIIGNVLNIANFLSHDKLLGKLKNDKFTNRAQTGVFGISDVMSSTAGRISDVLGMASHNEWNEKDMKTAAHMLPITGAMYGHWGSDKMIESMNLPRNRKAAGIE